MIDSVGEENLKGGALEVLERVVQYSKIVFLSWIVIDLLPNHFDLARKGYISRCCESF